MIDIKRISLTIQIKDLFQWNFTLEQFICIEMTYFNITMEIFEVYSIIIILIARDLLPLTWKLNWTFIDMMVSINSISCKNFRNTKKYCKYYSVVWVYENEKWKKAFFDNSKKFHQLFTTSDILQVIELLELSLSHVLLLTRCLPRSEL